ncbi:hypothetical protein [Brucella cytisi]|uniref:hypothetical protein n=1 Tax=Brucella cytisi TaxID=407152 RepID=UPI00313C7B45
MTITAFSNSCILYVFVVNRHLIVLFMAGIVTLQRLIVTGPNGAGKSYLAAKLAAVRPDVPIISFDNIKLIKNWEQRPKSQIEVKLLQALQSDAWILEGGPSLFSYAIPYADSLIWLERFRFSLNRMRFPNQFCSDSLMLAGWRPALDDRTDIE